ncbi:MAG: nucleotidyl transferase AbiEii/AbiGii toxin family protein [Actinomycetota bacterium]
MTRLVQAIDQLEHRGLPQHALVGGIAVIARLQQPHRATADIDAVYLGDEGDAVQILLAHGARPQANGVILAGGEKVDLISVGDYAVADLPENAGERAFVLAHRWALDGASRLTLVVTTSGGAVAAAVTTPVASVASLVAMKLASTRARRRGAQHKRASDVFDVFRLLSAHDADGSVARALQSAPGDLAPIVRDLASVVLVEEAVRSARWLQAAGDPQMQDVTAEDLRRVGTPLRNNLGTATP